MKAHCIRISFALALLVATHGFRPTAAEGQPSATVVIISASSDERPAPWMEHVVERVQTQVGNSIQLLPSSEASRRFEHQSSTAPAAIPQAQLESLPEKNQSAVRDLALGRYRSARANLAKTLALADRALEAVNRTPARHVMDACLFMVRANLESGQRKSAHTQALKCRKMFPGTQPTSLQLHTPEVRDILREAEGQLASGKRANLLVTSDPSGCIVRLNGQRVGSTPAHLKNLAAHDYRLQVECNEAKPRGRVHRIDLHEGHNALAVDASLERAVRTDGRISLRYDKLQGLLQERHEHAAKIAKIARVDEAWVISPTPERFRALVERVRVSDATVTAAAQLTVSDEEGEYLDGQRANRDIASAER